jgi:hypothetical protein
MACGLDPDVIDGFRDAVEELEARFPGPSRSDENAESSLHGWLDVPDPLPWADAEGVTEDEWFFVTTLYGQQTMDDQRRSIRKHFPTLFVQKARRDVRNFVPDLADYRRLLRAPWMGVRLCRMGEILRERRLSMADYARDLKRHDLLASPENPMPALDVIVRDHRATGWKTLSVFVRDCVKGSCFPIDSRVEWALKKYDLPVNERLLVKMSLHLDKNPRPIARMFFDAGAVTERDKGAAATV